jgi:hypothetical protein
MPLERSVLHSGLSSIVPSVSQYQASSEWVRAFIPYAQASTPGVANPALVAPGLEASLGITLASFAPGTFPSAIQSALISFWSSLIPAAIPGMTALLIPPTLGASIRIAMVTASGCIDPVTAMRPIADAIDSWTRSIKYGTPANGPTTPLI